jgi:DNA-binding GntR family transcriptional regulator
VDASYEWTKRRIAELSRHDGTLITEAEVSEGARTGRTPAREALLRLEAEGYLEILPRKGAFVRPISDSEIGHVMQARGVVEEWSVRQMLALGAEIADSLQSIIDEQRAVLGDPVAFIERDRLFHGTIVQSARNPVLAGFYEQLRERQIRMGLLALAGHPERASRVLTEHIQIVAAIKSGDALVAAAAIGSHLENTLTALKAEM